METKRTVIRKVVIDKELLNSNNESQLEDVMCCNCKAIRKEVEADNEYIVDDHYKITFDHNLFETSLIIEVEVDKNKRTEAQQLQDLLVDVKADLNTLHQEINQNYQNLREDVKSLCSEFVDDLDKFFTKKAALDKLNNLDMVFTCCDVDNKKIIDKMFKDKDND